MDILRTHGNKSQQCVKYTGCILFRDGTRIYGQGYGAQGIRVGEMCFNTAMTGYQEIISDPSYSQQIIAFTFPHIGNVGTNDDDLEAQIPLSAGIVTRELPTPPSNWRSRQSLPRWLEKYGLIGVGCVNTRALTLIIRDKGMTDVAMGFDENGDIDIAQMAQALRVFKGIKNTDLAIDATHANGLAGKIKHSKDRGHIGTVGVIDYGVKTNILNCLQSSGLGYQVFAAAVKAKELLAADIDGLFLSNGPGDPNATADYAVRTLKEFIQVKPDIPIFGICLGHQLLAKALGAAVAKMKMGHHGANHPVKIHSSGKVEITSMNHGFDVDVKTMPATLEVTHTSLFDGTNCGIRHKTKPYFSVQFHPEAAPGPHDNFSLFTQFSTNVHTYRQQHKP